MLNVQLTNNHATLKPPLISVASDLFDSPSAWLDSPHVAFESWISRQPVADSTRVVRTAMWGKFLRYLDSLGVRLDKCTPQHVAHFILSSGLEKEQAWRYIKLIERVYTHLGAIGLNLPNPGQHAGREGVNNRRNDPMRFLDQKEREKLENHLRSGLARAGDEIALIRPEKEKRKKEYAALWAVMRDATVAAVLYGAGVKVSELERLSVNCTSDVLRDGGTLFLPRSGFDLERRIPCLAVGSYALTAWLPVLSAEPSLGKTLFPALISRRRSDQLQQTAQMHPATVFRRVKTLLEDAGITDARACGQTLRNTYAAHLIESGMDDAAIADALGFTGDFSVSHLRQEHAAFFGRM